MVGHRTGSQFVQGEELGLVLADVLRSQAIGRAVEVLGKPLDQANVALRGSFRVMTTLEFFQHHFAQMGHRDHLLVTHNLSEKNQDCRHHTTRQRPPRQRLRSNEQ